MGGASSHRHTESIYSYRFPLCGGGAGGEPSWETPTNWVSDYEGKNIEAPRRGWGTVAPWAPLPVWWTTWEGICNPELFHEEQRFEPHILTTQLLKPEHWAPKTSSFESPQGLHRLSAQSPMQRQQLKSAFFVCERYFFAYFKDSLRGRCPI